MTVIAANARWQHDDGLWFCQTGQANQVPTRTFDSVIPPDPTASIAVLDCETATQDPTSVCAIGWTILARDRAGRWGQRECDSVLVRPPRNRYEGRNVEVHKITPERTADAPNLADAWTRQVRPALVAAGVGWLTSFNATFDAPALWASLRGANNTLSAGEANALLNNRDGKPWVFGCIMRTAFCHVSGLETRRLADLCENAGIEVGVLHDAADDSKAAAELLCWLMRTTGEGFPEITNNVHGGWMFFGSKGPSPINRSLVTTEHHKLLIGVTSDGRVHPKLLADQRYWGS